MNGYRFAGLDAKEKCLTCTNWKLSQSVIAGAAPCAVSPESRQINAHYGPHTVCSHWELADIVAVLKRTAILEKP